MEVNPVDNKVDNSIAAIWSMMLPGLGQLLKGQVMPGIFWALFVGAGYFMYFWPGLILHLICVLDAAFNKGENSILSMDKLYKKVLFILMIIFLLTYLVIRNF